MIPQPNPHLLPESLLLLRVLSFEVYVSFFQPPSRVGQLTSTARLQDDCRHPNGHLLTGLVLDMNVTISQLLPF